MKATDKQIKYFKFLAKKLESTLKFHYCLYSRQNKTLVQMVEAFKNDIENGKDIPKNQMSFIINELLKELNKY